MGKSPASWTLDSRNGFRSILPKIPSWSPVSKVTCLRFVGYLFFTRNLSSAHSLQEPCSCSSVSRTPNGWQVRGTSLKFLGPRHSEWGTGIYVLADERACIFLFLRRYTRGYGNRFVHIASGQRIVGSCSLLRRQ